MKYIAANLLRKELQKPKNELKDGNYYLDNSEQAVGYENALVDFELLIDSLQQEQPEVDLEKEIDTCWQNWLSPSNQKEVEGVLPKTEFATYARHFAEWGAEHLKR